MAEWKQLVNGLRGMAYQRGHIEFEPGLTDTEIGEIEERFNFRFPPDLSEFLQAGLPYGEGFPDWRSNDERSLRDWLDLPRDGVAFDVRSNGVWLPSWGPKPEESDQAERLINELVRAAPTLIPVYSHRMIPEGPRAGNPVFSVHQTDIIVYGCNLASYLCNEFKVATPTELNRGDKAQQIEFWSAIVKHNSIGF